LRNTSLIEIRVMSEVKEEAAEIANRIAEVYKQNRLDQTSKLSDDGIKKLKEELEERHKDVEAQQAKMDNLRDVAGITELNPSESNSQTIIFEQAQLLQQESKRTDVDQRYRELSTQYEELLSQPPEKRRHAIMTIVQVDDNLAQLMRNLTIAEQERATKEKEFGPEHVEMAKVLNLIKEVNSQIDARVDGLMQGLKTKVIAAKNENDSLQTTVKDLRQKIEKTQSAIGNYLFAKRELENRKQVHDNLNLKIQQEIINANIGRHQIVTITDGAEVGLKPVRPNMLLNVCAGILVGLILGVGLAFFIEYLDTSVKTIDDVERALGSPVLGVIPQNVGAIMEEGPESPHAEAYRVLRTNLIFARKNPAFNTITVVSGGAGEGKSTTILNLSTIFAQNGQRVLLVDSDLRRPSLHKRLNLSNALGLTNYLLQQNKLEEVIQTTSVQGMDFLPSGRLPSSSLGILNSPQMKEFVNEVKKRYDFVFFDSPPIMGVSDASILVSEMDMTLLVIQYRKYPQQMTIRSKQMVDKVGGNLVGVVLNNINISQDAYYYYYSGYAYNDYAKKGREEDERPAVATKSKSNGDQAKLEIRQKY
jgi:succinoglycan biosynthesis transport protein ExoP